MKPTCRSRRSCSTSTSSTPSSTPAFSAPTVDDVIGPVPVDEVFTVYQVVAKVMPSIEDPEIVRRAEEGVLARLLAGEVNRRVRWHADF